MDSKKPTGRPRVSEEIEKAVALEYDKHRLSAEKIAQKYGVSVATLYRIVNERSLVHQKSSLLKKREVLIEGAVFPGTYGGALSFIVALRQHGIARVVMDDKTRAVVKDSVKKNCKTVAEAQKRKNLPGISNPDDYERLSVPGKKDRFAYEVFYPKGMDPKEAFAVVKESLKSSPQSWSVFQEYTLQDPENDKAEVASESSQTK